LPVIPKAQAAHQSRLSQRAPLGDALGFYAHAVVQSALGWHIGWWLQSAAGRDGATAIIGAVLAALFAWALVASPLPTRLLIAAALLTGFIFTVVSADRGFGFARIGVGVTVQHEAGSRYAALAIFLVDCAAIAAIDALVQRCHTSRQSSRRDLDSLLPRARGWQRGIAPALALLAVLAVLSVGWVTDYRFETPRTLGAARPWSTVLAAWENRCAGNPAGTVQVVAWDLPPKVTESIPCARIRHGLRIDRIRLVYVRTAAQDVTSVRTAAAFRFRPSTLPWGLRR